MRALFLSAAFRDPANRGALIKSPVDLIVGHRPCARPAGAGEDGPGPHAAGLGQVPFDPPNVKGWAGGESWISTYTLLLRQQFLRRMIEATTVAPMEGGMRMADRPNRRADRREQLPADRRRNADDGAAAAGGRPQPAQCRYRGCASGSTLAGVDGAALLRTLLPRQPVDGGGCQRDRGRRRGGGAARHVLSTEVRRGRWAVFSCWSS